jgi:DNA replication protein DnaC
MVEIEKQLKALRLSGMLATLESRILQANQSNAAFVDALSWLLQDEMDQRSSCLRQRRFKASGLSELKTLSEFDWGFNPKLPKKEIYELVTVKFVQNGEHALLIGSPGTGKSHIAKTIAHAAVQLFQKTIYREANVFFEDMFEAEQTDKKKRVCKMFSEADLLVIDDLFLRKRMPKDAADYLLDIITLLRNFRVAPSKSVCYRSPQGMWKGNTWEDQHGTFNHPWEDNYVLRYRPNTVFDQQIS